MVCSFWKHRYQGQTYYFNPGRNDQLSYGLNVVGDKALSVWRCWQENAGQLVKAHLKMVLSNWILILMVCYGGKSAFLQMWWCCYYMNTDGKLVTGHKLLMVWPITLIRMVDRSRENAVRSVVILFLRPDNGIQRRTPRHLQSWTIHSEEENYTKEIRFDSAPLCQLWQQRKTSHELRRYYFGADGLPVRMANQ